MVGSWRQSKTTIKKLGEGEVSIRKGKPSQKSKQQSRSVQGELANKKP
jgi:hypothetical protein